MSESSRAWAPLKKEFDRRGLHYTRIENSADPGTPDVNVHINGRDHWIELKYIDHAESGMVNLELRREQYIWLRDGARAGRNCCLVARLKSDRWLLLADEAGWELAKHSTHWNLLLSAGCLVNTADLFVYLFR